MSPIRDDIRAIVEACPEGVLTTIQEPIRYSDPPSDVPFVRSPGGGFRIQVHDEGAIEVDCLKRTKPGGPIKAYDYNHRTGATTDYPKCRTRDPDIALDFIREHRRFMTPLPLLDVPPELVKFHRDYHDPERRQVFDDMDIFLWEIVGHLYRKHPELHEKKIVCTVAPHAVQIDVLVLGVTGDSLVLARHDAGHWESQIRLSAPDLLERVEQVVSAMMKGRYA